MTPVIVGSLVTPEVKGLSANSTANAWSALSDTRTEPPVGYGATRTVIDNGVTLASDLTALRVTPYGGNDNNDQLSVKVVGWNRLVPLPQQGNVIWRPRLICQVLCTLSSSLPGLAGGDVLSTEYYADTISLTTGVALIYQGTADTDVAWFLCDVSGYERVEVLGKLETGGDTMNWLVARQ